MNWFSELNFSRAFVVACEFIVACVAVNEFIWINNRGLTLLLSFDVFNVVEFSVINAEFCSFTEFEQLDNDVVCAFCFKVVEEMDFKFGIVIIVEIVLFCLIYYPKLFTDSKVATLYSYDLQALNCLSHPK